MWDGKKWLTVSFMDDAILANDWIILDKEVIR